MRLAHAPSRLECWAGWVLGLQALRTPRSVPSMLQAGGSRTLRGLRLQSPLGRFSRLPLPSSL